MHFADFADLANFAYRTCSACSMQSHRLHAPICAIAAPVQAGLGAKTNGFCRGASVRGWLAGCGSAGRLRVRIVCGFVDFGNLEICGFVAVCGDAFITIVHFVHFVKFVKFVQADFCAQGDGQMVGWLHALLMLFCDFVILSCRCVVGIVVVMLCKLMIL